MLHLTFIDGATETAVVASSPYFRITGGTLHGMDDEGPLAIFEAEGWKYGPAHFSGIRIEGICQLVSGITRDLQMVCEPLRTLALDGRILLANALPFARYEPKRDMWDGLMRRNSWHSLRIISGDWLGAYGAPAVEATVRG